MKQYVLEFIGYCMGFLNSWAKPRKPQESIQIELSSPGPCPVDLYETGSDRRPEAEHLLQIGVIALDLRPNMPGVCAHITASGRRPLGPVRIIGSVG